MPKLNHNQKKEEPGSLEQVMNEKDRRCILKAVRATEMHMVISCVAIGILQSLSVNLEGTLNSGQLRCQRTPARGRVSEAALMHHLRKYFFLFMEKQQESRKTQIIKQQQEESGIYWDSLAS